MSEGIRVGVFAPLYPPAIHGGGPIRSIAALIHNAPEAARVRVVTSDRDLGSHEPLDVERNGWVHQGNRTVYYATVGSPVRLISAMRSLKKHRPQLLHFNSYFTPGLTILPLMLWRIGFWGPVTLLLSPRGEFGSGALRRRTFKKRLYITLFRMLRMHRHVIWHSTASHESDAIRALWGDGARIVFRENDTLIPVTARAPQLHPGSRLRAVYLGRIVEHKGLHIALEALQHVDKSVTLDIYGNAQDAAYTRRCEFLAAQLPAHVTASFHGSVPPDAVGDILAEHDVLVLPTAGENFGHVIAEALAASVAVITTPTTPWTQTLSDGAGMIADRNPQAWSDALNQLASLSPNEVIDMRKRAGERYAQWAERPQAPHVWELLLDSSTASTEQGDRSAGF